ncbi:MAG: hypothetical protein GY754_03975 [bacterium]|nr:hypothetical protein [bacterium]
MARARRRTHTPATQFVNTDSTQHNKLVVIIDGMDYTKDLYDVGLSLRSSESEIMSIVRPIIQEVFNRDIRGAYKVHKAFNTESIFVIPNSVAG